MAAGAPKARLPNTQPASRKALNDPPGARARAGPALPGRSQRWRGGSSEQLAHTELDGGLVRQDGGLESCAVRNGHVGAADTSDRRIEVIEGFVRNLHGDLGRPAGPLGRLVADQQAV